LEKDCRGGRGRGRERGKKHSFVHHIVIFFIYLVKPAEMVHHFD
jgi:hypothetical protein